MESPVRTLIDLPEADVRALDRLGKRLRVSRAKIIREAVSAFLAKTTGATTQSAFGLWRGANIDGLDHQRRIRSEW
jgi:metal-responsive CopG/Arc/MetJ family transcriptional regulator